MRLSRSFATVTLALLVFLGLGWSGEIPPAPSLDSLVVQLFWLLVLSLPVVLAASAVHVLGHVVGIAVAGFDCLFVRIGPLTIAPGPAGWRSRVDFAGSTQGLLGGRAASHPRGMERLRLRDAVFCILGPTAQLMLAGALVAVSIRTSQLITWALTLAVGLPALLELVPWWPVNASDWTDGRWVWLWLVDPTPTLRQVAAHKLYWDLHLPDGPKLPRDVDNQWLRLSLANRDRSDVASTYEAAFARWIAYYRALDLGDLGDAHRSLSRLAAAPGQRQRDAYLVESAFFAARYGHDPSLADQLLRGVTAHGESNLVEEVARARAAVHLAWGQYELSVAACEEALTMLMHITDPDVILIYRAHGSKPIPDGLRLFLRQQVLAIRVEAVSAIGQASHDR
jgi:hypothetical protein